MIWILGSTFLVVVLVLMIVTRSRRRVDLGSVSRSWTTEYNAAERGGDQSNG